MKYKNIRNKTQKFYKGGMIPKYEEPSGPLTRQEQQFELIKQLRKLTTSESQNAWQDWQSQHPITQYNDDPEKDAMYLQWNDFVKKNPNLGLADNKPTAQSTGFQPSPMPTSFNTEIQAPQSQFGQTSITMGNPNGAFGTTTSTFNTAQTNQPDLTPPDALEKQLYKVKRKIEAGDTAKGVSAQVGGALATALGSQLGAGGESGAMAINSGIGAMMNGDLKGGGMALGAGAATMAMSAVDKFAMGDKNFGAQSEAIDAGVHGISKTLMSSGNPYAMLAAGVLEGANFLTKAGGDTVQGFDVDIKSSGYGNLGHMESKSSRNWGAALGPLGSFFANGNTEAKLAKRNEQARMALTAAEISTDQSFEQEARMNNVENTIMNNQIALAGGLETNLLAG